MIKCSPLSKIKKQFVLLFTIFLFACNENSNQQVEKKINDTISTNLKAEPVKNNNKNLPHRNIENGSKSRIAGKTFVAKLSQSCRATTNGAYDIYIFLNLSFDLDSVTITQQRVDTETHIIDEKKFHWAIEGNAVTIDHFDDYGKLEIKSDRLIGNEYDGSKIEFINKDVHPFSR